MPFSETVRTPKFWLIAIPVVVLLAVVVGPFVYINFIKEDAPDPLTFDDIGTATSTTAGGSDDTTATAGADDGIDGSWEVAAGSTAGYRATEVLFGQSTEGAGRTEDVTGTLVIEGTTASEASFEVDLTTREKVIIYPLVALTIFFGVYPAPIFDVTQVSVDTLINEITASIDAVVTTASVAN